MAALPHNPCGNARLLLLSAGERLASIWCCFIWHFKSKQKWGEELRFSEEEWHEEEEEEREGWLAWGSILPRRWSPELVLGLCPVSPAGMCSYRGCG